MFGVRADGDTVLCTRTTAERKIFSGAYADVTTEEIAVAGIERLFAVVEHRNRIVDITPRDNRLEIEKIHLVKLLESYHGVLPLKLVQFGLGVRGSKAWLRGLRVSM